MGCTEWNRSVMKRNSEGPSLLQKDDLAGLCAPRQSSLTLHHRPAAARDLSWASGCIWKPSGPGALGAAGLEPPGPALGWSQ